MNSASLHTKNQINFFLFPQTSRRYSNLSAHNSFSIPDTSNGPNRKKR